MNAFKKKTGIKGSRNEKINDLFVTWIETKTRKVFRTLRMKKKTNPKNRLKLNSKTELSVKTIELNKQ